MSIWIATIGNRDIQLNNNSNWFDLYDKVRIIPPLSSCENFGELGEPDEETEFYLASARVLGLVYGQQKDYYQDLSFPLLDVFVKSFQENPNNTIELPSRIIILLTDQQEIFQNNEFEFISCPFWQDTCTLKSLFEWYFQENLNIEPEFLTIQPISSQNKGIDHWNEMLTQVKSSLEEKLSALNIDNDELVYVSHQAGTPAISSAIQFLSISQFEQVKFLVSNKFYNYEEEKWQYEAELINSSNYWQGLQIQKAKQLLIDGFPGAAKELLQGLISAQQLDEIQRYVEKFNIQATVDDKSLEFTPEDATKRIRDALDLIEIFLKQENYLQGITLLTAAQETFMKAAIKVSLQKIKFAIAKKKNSEKIEISELIVWDEKGLYLRSKNKLKDISGFYTFCNNIQNLEKILNFPLPTNIDKWSSQDPNSSKDYDNFWSSQKKNGYIFKGYQHQQFTLEKISNTTRFKPNNSRMLKWLQKFAQETLSLTDWEWELLKWLCKYKREYDDDLRNQIMHNLRGVKKKDVLMYLYGYKKEEKEIDIENLNVHKVYRKEVKKRFIKAMYDLGLYDNPLDENYLEQELKKLANKLN